MKLLKDPLVLFLVIGVALFALDGWRTAREDHVIRVGPLDIARLQDQWTAQMRRAPRPDELNALIDDHVREEMLVREALAMGLDAGDVIIRRRLAQKLTFLTEDLALLEPATEAEHRAFFAEHGERYRVPARITFSHVFFSPDRRADAGADATAARPIVGDHNWRSIGDPFMLRRTHAKVTDADVRKDFGVAFATALGALSGAGWQGPVESSYGFHLVRVEERAPGRLPTFAEVRQAIAADFDAERRNVANARHREDLAERYRVEITR